MLHNSSFIKKHEAGMTEAGAVLAGDGAGAGTAFWTARVGAEGSA